MSSKGQVTGKWVSSRVLRQQQQQQQQQTGGKIMEDSAIAAARIKDNRQGSPTAVGEVDVPQARAFERQEATDALSNLAHSQDSTPYELQGEPTLLQAQTSDAFHQKLHEVIISLQ